MKIAVVGSRSITNIDLAPYISQNDEIISGGARGVDTCAAEFARQNHLILTVFLPQYDRYGRAAPIVRNKEIVDCADKVFVFWDGHSKGTNSVIRYAKKTNTPCEIILCNPTDQSK